MLDFTNSDPDSMNTRITSDKFWVYVYNPETKSLLFFLKWKSDKSSKHYLTQILLAINAAPDTCLFLCNSVEYMHFYGPNDKPLGRFLEDHCFCSSYKCPSLPCLTPVDLHVRRYVHDVGCVHIILKELDKQIPDTDGSGIVMWSWCSKCKMVSLNFSLLM